MSTSRTRWIGIVCLLGACAEEPVENSEKLDGSSSGAVSASGQDANVPDSASGASIRDATAGSGDTPDARSDAPDAGSTSRDAGANRDAGAPLDAGARIDAGASALDASTASDAGTTANDAAQGSDSSLLTTLRTKTMYSAKPTGAATWLVNADANATRATIDADMNAAGNGRFPVFTLYRYYASSGSDANAHRAWVTAVADAVGKHANNAVLVLEPDAFALKDRPDVDSVLDAALGILAEKAPNAAVFLDIGHSKWLSADAVAARAKSYKNFASIEGFASNTSNFQATAQEEAYARQLLASANKPTIIDTSRNGLGRQPSTIFNPPDSEWDPGPPFAFHPDDPAVFFNYYNKPSNERD